MTRFALPLLCLLACACGSGETPAPPADNRAEVTAPTQAPLQPPAPGEPDGLPDDRKPVEEEAFSSGSAQGAAAVLQTYYALIEEANYGEAFHLREQRPDGPTEEQFAASFKDYAEYHANIGRPSEVQGAAGSLYVEVPVQTYGRYKDGKPFSSAGTVALRRSNNIPGGNNEWRIYTGG